jgi:hypothetical protein
MLPTSALTSSGNVITATSTATTTSTTTTATTTKNNSAVDSVATEKQQAQPSASPAAIIPTTMDMTKVVKILKQNEPLVSFFFTLELVDL